VEETTGYPSSDLERKYCPRKGEGSDLSPSKKMTEGVAIEKREEEEKSQGTIVQTRNQ